MKTLKIGFPKSHIGTGVVSFYQRFNYPKKIMIRTKNTKSAILQAPKDSKEFYRQFKYIKCNIRQMWKRYKIKLKNAFQNSKKLNCRNIMLRRS